MLLIPPICALDAPRAFIHSIAASASATRPILWNYVGTALPRRSTIAPSCEGNPRRSHGVFRRGESPQGAGQVPSSDEGTVAVRPLWHASLSYATPISS